ncbi:c-type cytochrome [bacterium]|nr:c-type cytochrome [bacterium]
MRTLAILALISGLHVAKGQSLPQLHDDRLTLTLFAEDPDIETPIGMAIAPDNRIFVVESHTHTPPEGYPGPKGDRIRVFQDKDQDGIPETNIVFAENLVAAMNITITEEGRVFVVGARTVWELIDADKDNQSESRRLIAEVKTTNTYPHSCLLSITHSVDGWLYLGRGNNGSAAYSIVGTDGSAVSGFGDGGNISRCRFDGTSFEEFATGFWNPFDLEFDQSGHLLAVDNDPDARGPNRLVHVVQHGDYGYKSIYGGGGNHAYQGWDGSLPGTLPFVSGTGEAPSGLLDARRAALPDDYNDSILVTVWNEHTIERHHTQSIGGTLTATSSVLVTGSLDFRPVAIDTDSHGNIFITDWVKVDYPNHGKGRIWRLASKTSSKKSKPQPYDAGKSSTKRRSLRSISEFSVALSSSDPFERHAGIVMLSQREHQSTQVQLSKTKSATLRLGALLAIKRSAPETSDHQINAFLNDSDPRIRQATLRWIGEHGLVQFTEKLFQALQVQPTSPELFQTYLATHEVLQSAFLKSLRERSKDKASQIPRTLDLSIVKQAIENKNLSSNLRAIALTHYPHTTASDASAYLQNLLLDSPPLLKQQVIRSLSDLNGEAIQRTLETIASDETQSIILRRESLLALEKFPLTSFDSLIELTRSEKAPIVLSTIRLLAIHQNVPEVKSAINRCYVIHRNRPNSTDLVEQLEDILYSEPGCCQPRVTYRPQSLEEWQHTLRTGGNPQAGEAVFHSIKSGCAQCHTIDNRGGKLGPDLSNAGQSVDRQQLIHSILKPSSDFPPQFQAWVIETKDGEEHRGLQLDHKSKGAIELFTLLGKTERFEGTEIERYYAAPQSLMPDGLESGLSTSEMRDLVAYLESRK